MNYTFTTLDTVLVKLNTELKNFNFDEYEAIEWAGEAMDSLKAPEIQEQVVMFAKVVDHHVVLPKGFKTLLQVARYTGDINCDVITENYPECDITEEEGKPFCDPNNILPAEPGDCGTVSGLINMLYEAYANPYKPYYTQKDMVWGYTGWVASPAYINEFVPVRLATSTMFNSIVCKEKSYADIYKSCVDEYTIVGSMEKALRLSFKEGFVAVAYNRAVMDTETGFPMIPDEFSFIQAINYYIRWKIAEAADWEGREGFAQKSDISERKWLKYRKQAMNSAKMLKTIDEYQNSIEETHQLIPRRNRAANFFGNLGKRENQFYNQLDTNYNRKYVQ